MSAKSKTMSQIKQVMQLHIDGISNREIGRQLNLYKGTVNKYINLAKSDPLPIEELLKLDDPILESRLLGGTVAYTDNRFEEFQNRLPYIAEELSQKHKTHVTLRLLWEEYKKDCPNGYEYTQFCYHYKQYSDVKKISFVMKQDRQGGEYLHIDFAGDTLEYIDIETGEVVECQVFVAVLPASDYPFFLAVHSQKIEDFLHGIECSFRKFGGVPKILVPDNLKSAVTKSDRYQPELNHIMEDFANHHGCVVIPARSGKPKDKSNAEGSVCRGYRWIYAPLRHHQFFSLQELNKAISDLQCKYVQKRMQQIPFTREERFISLDKPNLKSLHSEQFEIISRVNLKVQDNCYVYLGRDKCYYSVPHKYLGLIVKVEYTNTKVSIYYGGEKIAMHTRCPSPGNYIYKIEHFPSYYQHYVNQSPEKYIERALAVSEPLADVMMNMFTGNNNVPPENYYKSCDGLFHLQKLTDKELFDKSCIIAIKYNNCKYSFIKNLIESKCAGYEMINSTSVSFPSDAHTNIRGKTYYY